jgi:DNA-binding LytR/AlgR family response regulator
VDDELPALAELEFLLAANPLVAAVHAAGDATEALRLLERERIDAVFVDIRMPGLSGLDLVRTLSHFADPPAVVMVTAYEDAAVDAFALRVVDYLLKPLDADRLAEAVRRVAEARGRPAPVEDETLAVELAGVTRFVHRSEVQWVEAHGDYARLHTADGGSHLVRIPLSTLEERWGRHGFVRIHRSYLIAVAQVTELRGDSSGGHVVRVAGVELPVSRRSARGLKDLLVNTTLGRHGARSVGR